MARVFIVRCLRTIANRIANDFNVDPAFFALETRSSTKIGV